MSKKPRKQNVLNIRHPEQIRAIRSPERIRILEAMTEHGSLTVKQLGDIMGRVPQALYYHVKELVKVGILVEDCVVKSKRRPEKRYRLKAPKLKLDVHNNSDEIKSEIASIASSLLRSAERNYRESITEHEPVLSGRNRNFASLRFQMKLSPAQIRELNTRLSELETFMNELEPTDSAEEYVVTVVLSPTK